MKTLFVPDMHCMHCVSRINTAFSEHNIPVTISLEEHTVQVPDTAETVSLAIELLDDLGFDATEK